MRQGISGDIRFRVSFGACAEAVREFAVFEHSASFGFGFPRVWVCIYASNPNDT